MEYRGNVLAVQNFDVPCRPGQDLRCRGLVPSNDRSRRGTVGQSGECFGKYTERLECIHICCNARTVHSAYIYRFGNETAYFLHFCMSIDLVNRKYFANKQLLLFRLHQCDCATITETATLLLLVKSIMSTRLGSHKSCTGAHSSVFLVANLNLGQMLLVAVHRASLWAQYHSRSPNRTSRRDLYSDSNKQYRLNVHSKVRLHFLAAAHRSIEDRPETFTSADSLQGQE